MKLMLYLRFMLKFFYYEIKYYLVGGSSIFEDIVNRRYNKCRIVKKRGQVAVVTGGNRGIGAELVRKLLLCDYHVIIGCRDPSSFKQVSDKLCLDGITSDFYEVLPLDLSSFKSVKRFSDLIKLKHNSIELLINNAGIMFPPYEETEDGYESQWQVNFLSPFLLTHCLMDLLKRSSVPARIINLTSCAHLISPALTDFDPKTVKSYFITGEWYARSKLALLMFTLSLEEIQGLKENNVHAFAVHPGVVNTELFNRTLLKKYFPWILTFFCKSPSEGATSILYACTSPSLEGTGGLYLTNCRITKPSYLVENSSMRSALFKNTLNLLKIDEFGKSDSHLKVQKK